VCGYPQALAHAQFLGADDMILGAAYCLMIILFALFLAYLGVTIMLVGLKALFFGIIVGPAFLCGIAGFYRARAFARHCGWQIGIHAVEMTAFTAYLGIVTGWIMWVLTTNSIGAADSMVTPRMIMLGVGSVVAAMLFHFIDKKFHADGLGTIGHYVSSGYHATTGAARGHYDDARGAVEQGRKAHRRFRDWRNRGIDDDHDPDEDDVQASAEAEKSAPGFDVLKPRPTDGGAADGATTSTTASGAGAVVADGAGVAEVGTLTTEGAAAVVAPEVVPPAEVIAETAHLAHRRHDKHAGGDTPQEAGGRHLNNGARQQSRQQWPDSEVEPPSEADYQFLNESRGDEGAYPTVAPRSRRTESNGHRHNAWEQPAHRPDAEGWTGYDVVGSGQEALPIERVTDAGADDDPALEFPATPPQQDLDPTSAKGQQQ
jgi:hypothetical protein